MIVGLRTSGGTSLLVLAVKGLANRLGDRLYSAARTFDAHQTLRARRLLLHAAAAEDGRTLWQPAAGPSESARRVTRSVTKMARNWPVRLRRPGCYEANLCRSEA
jgi:hypothetical protein